MAVQQTVLIVDDHRPLADNLAEILDTEGFAPLVVESGEEALQVCRSGRVLALIITDFKLPGLDGANLVRTLRREDVDVPVLLISAYTDQETIDTANAAGVNAVLAKPVDIPDLVRRVHELAP